MYYQPDFLKHFYMLSYVESGNSCFMKAMKGLVFGFARKLALERLETQRNCSAFFNSQKFQKLILCKTKNKFEDKTHHGWTIDKPNH